MACPGDDVLVAMIERALDPTQLSALEVHLDSCESCREVVAIAVGSRPAHGLEQTQLATGTPNTLGVDVAAHDPEGLIGSTIAARYRMQSVLGRGGMGTVYLARDITLDRDVAVKVHRSGSAKDRLQREAVVMAQLAHPNVVNVFEVGSVDEWPFVAMEYVRGATLREWLKTPRKWQAIVGLLLETGAGLAAAHAAGLVHRDFKPENVLVGTDGRPRVSDFGLARVDRDPGVAPSLAASATSLDVAITIEGTVLGTPAYMAPEQFEGAAVDARADQFAFAVVAWEALFGQRPFEGATLAAVQLAIKEHAFARPAAAQVPERVRKVVERGLAAAPGDRYADMATFLDALRRAAAPRTTRVLGIAALATAAIVAIAIPAGGKIAERRHVAACDAEADEIRGVFGPTAQTIMFSRFAAARRPAAGEKFERTARVLDRQVKTLVDHSSAACRDRAPQVRRACLAERVADFRGTIAAFERADVTLVMRGPDAAWGSFDPSPCDDLTANRGVRSQPTPEQRQSFAQARRASALGKYADGVALVAPIVDQARARGDKALELEALLELGQLRVHIDQPEAVAPLFHQAAAIAETLGHDMQSITALASLIDLAKEARDFVGAHRDIELARGKLARMGGPNTSIEGKLLLLEAKVLASEYKKTEAEATLRKGIATLEPTMGSDHPVIGNAYGMLSQLLQENGKAQESVVAIRHAMQILESALGPNHPTVAGTRMTLGVALIDLDQLDEARTLLLEADKVFVKTFGPGHPVRTGIIGRLARIDRSQGHLDKALAEFRDTLARASATEGPDSLIVAGTHMDIAVTLAQMARFEEALAEAQQGLAITEAAQPADLPQLSSAYVDNATIQLSAGHPAVAIGYAEKALATFAKQTESLNVGERSAGRFVLAKSLLATHGDRDRAYKLVDEALADAPESTEIKTWLAAHPR